MTCRTAALAGTFALILSVAQSASGQTTYRPTTGTITAAPRTSSRPSTANKPRIGWITQTPAPVPAQNGAPTAGFLNGPPQVAAFYYLPTVVLTDGRVFANFNGTYEQVLRQCPITSGPVPPGFATPACWIVDAYGRYQVIQQR